MDDIQKGIGADNIHDAKSLLPPDKSNENISPRKRKLTTGVQLRDNLEHIVSEINAKRKRDADNIDEIKKEMEVHVSTMIVKLEESIFGLSNQTNQVMEEKMQQLMSVLSRIEKHEADLEELKRALESLNRDVFSTVTSPED